MNNLNNLANINATHNFQTPLNNANTFVPPEETNSTNVYNILQRTIIRKCSSPSVMNKHSSNYNNYFPIKSLINKNVPDSTIHTNSNNLNFNGINANNTSFVNNEKPGQVSILSAASPLNRSGSAHVLTFPQAITFTKITKPEIHTSRQPSQSNVLMPPKFNPNKKTIGSEKPVAIEQEKPVQRQLFPDLNVSPFSSDQSIITPVSDKEFPPINRQTSNENLEHNDRSLHLDQVDDVPNNNNTNQLNIPPNIHNKPPQGPLDTLKSASTSSTSSTPPLPPDGPEAPAYSDATGSGKKILLAAVIGCIFAKVQGTDYVASALSFAITTFATQLLLKYTNRLHRNYPVAAWSVETYGQLSISATSITAMYAFQVINGKGAIALSAVSAFLFISNQQNLNKAKKAI